MKTSKIKTIDQVKEWDGGNGKIIFHSMQMENGDFVNIGTKAPLSVGNELTYETHPKDDGQQKYVKIKKVNTFQKGGGFKSNPVGQVVGMAINNAISLVNNGVIESKEVERTAQWIIDMAAKLIENNKNKF